MVVLRVVVALEAVQADNVTANDDDMRVISDDTVIAVLTIYRIATVTADQDITVVTAQDCIVRCAGGTGE